MVPGDHPSAAAPMRPSQSRVQRWRCRAKALTFRLLVWNCAAFYLRPPHASSTACPASARKAPWPRNAPFARPPVQSTLPSVGASQPASGSSPSRSDPAHIRTAGAALGSLRRQPESGLRNLAQRGCAAALLAMERLMPLVPPRAWLRPALLTALRRAQPEPMPRPAQPRRTAPAQHRADPDRRRGRRDSRVHAEDQGPARRARHEVRQLLRHLFVLLPSRASILRGQYAHNTHIVGNEQPWGGSRSSASWGSSNRPWPPGCRTPAITPR